MDTFVAYQLQQILKTNKNTNTIPLKVDTTYNRYSCSKCGQNQYFCQCFNHGITAKHNLSYISYRKTTT